MHKQLLAFGAITALAIPVMAEPASLPGRDLHGFVAGKTVVLKTSMGPLPITYRDNGTMQGRANSQPLAVYAGQAQDHGIWWISAGQVCQRWSKWLEGRAHCITFQLDGRVVHWRSNDGHEGTAIIASN